MQRKDDKIHWSNVSISDENRVRHWMLHGESEIWDIPVFRPYTYGSNKDSAPIFCSNKEDWIYLHKAIVHQREIEEIIKDLDVQCDERQTILFTKGVASLVNPTLKQLQSSANAQLTALTRQSEAITKLLESKLPVHEEISQYPVAQSAAPAISSTPTIQLTMGVQPQIAISPEEVNGEEFTKHLKEFFLKTISQISLLLVLNWISWKQFSRRKTMLLIFKSSKNTAQK